MTEYITGGWQNMKPGDGQNGGHGDDILLVKRIVSRVLDRG
jgi:hypothetical protein